MLNARKFSKVGFGAILVVALLLISVLIAKSSFAYVSGPDADSVMGVMRGGTDEDFAKNAPIATVDIDLSNNTGIELSQSSLDNGFFIDDHNFVQKQGVAMKYGFTELGAFTLVYKNAATTSTGEKKDVEVTFDLTLAGRESNGNYTDNVRLISTKAAPLDGDSELPFSITPQSYGNGTGKNPGKHFGLRGTMNLAVAGASSNDTFIFSMYGINGYRGSGAFLQLFEAATNDNYSESVEQLSGISSESDIYVPEDFAASQVSGLVNSGDIRFLAGGKDGDYSSGYALTAEVNGYKTEIWSDAGNPGFLSSRNGSMNMRVFPQKLSHTSTSASGEGGKIELWTDGQVDSGATKLDGGSLDLPRSYTVPNGKIVTYKMTPSPGYEIDTLTVNGEVVTPNEVRDDAGNILYYSYTFEGYNLDGTVLSDNQNIEVSWYKLPEPDPQPEPVVPSIVPPVESIVPAVPKTGQALKY